MGSFNAACGFWKQSIEDRGMNYFCVIASVRQRLSKQTLRILSSADSFGLRRSFLHLE